MPTIWKYPLRPGRTELGMPFGASVLTVQMQNQEPMLWAQVDPDAPQESRVFDVYGTGHPMPKAPGKYVATFQAKELVWHVFEAG